MTRTTYYDTAMEILYAIATNEDGQATSRIQAAEALAHLAQSGPPFEHESEKPPAEKKGPPAKVPASPAKKERA